MIDALTVCFEVENRYHFDRISSLDYGETYDLYEYQLSRIEDDITIMYMPLPIWMMIRK